MNDIDWLGERVEPEEELPRQVGSSHQEVHRVLQRHPRPRR